MILLDTNALLWLIGAQKRTRRLVGRNDLCVSPASLLEIEMLIETARIELIGTIAGIREDDRWAIDDPPAAEWFAEAEGLAWTRDPFDRLLAAHARLRRWKLATSDARIIEHLGPSRILAL
ncbi:MAG: type II toxin-antitoxin system VapC family toxin [Polyangiaceae bacterium]